MAQTWLESKPMGMIQTNVVRVIPIDPNIKHPNGKSGVYGGLEAWLNRKQPQYIPERLVYARRRVAVLWRPSPTRQPTSAASRSVACRHCWGLPAMTRMEAMGMTLTPTKTQGRVHPKRNTAAETTGAAVGWWRAAAAAAAAGIRRKTRTANQENRWDTRDFLIAKYEIEF